MPNRITTDIEKGIKLSQRNLEEIHEAESNNEYSPDIRQIKLER